VAIIPAWFLWTPFLHVIQQPFCTAVHNLPLGNRPPTGCRLIVNGVVDALLVKLKVVIFMALFIAAVAGGVLVAAAGAARIIQL